MKSEPSFVLLDMSIRWPPDFQPFIAGRLRSLAKNGVRIYVTTASHQPVNHALMEYATVVRLPSANESGYHIALRTVTATARILLTRPVRTFRAAAIGIARSRSVAEFAWWWANAAPLLTLRVDIVHFEWNGLATTFDWLPPLIGAPYVVSCRGRQVNIQPHIPGEESSRAELSRSFDKATLVHGVCAEILKEAERLGMAREKGRVVYTSVDLDFFKPNHPIQTQDAKVRILSVGVCMWRKGYEYLLLAFKRILDGGVDATLEIADFSGPELDRINETIRDLDIGRRVKLLGTLSPALVREALWRCDLFVLPALSEGISNAVVEAMASGVPVITTVCGGMREAVTDGVEGRLTPLRDVQGLTEAILELSGDRGLREKMGKAGRKRAERTFNPERQASQFKLMYSEALLEHGRAGIRAESEPTLNLAVQSPNNWTIQDQSLSNPEAPSNELHIVTVAELHWRNGHEYALEAMKLLKDRGVRFRYTLIGKGPFLEAVGFARYQLGLLEEVEMILDDADGDTHLATADLFLLASVAEGASHALDAAVSRGIPVVCSNLESFEAATDGYLERRIVPRREPVAIMDAIVSLASPQMEHGTEPQTLGRETGNVPAPAAGKRSGSN